MEHLINDTMPYKGNWNQDTELINLQFGNAGQNTENDAINERQIQNRNDLRQDQYPAISLDSFLNMEENY